MKQLARIIMLLLLLGTAVTLTTCSAPKPTPPAATVAIPPTTVPTAAPPTAAYPANGYTVNVAPPPLNEAYPAPELAEPVSNAPLYTFQVVNEYPHDPDAFTQGLIWFNDEFYEGTGQRGHSSLRRVNPETGEVQQIISLPDNYFGEGIVLWEDKIIQITWQEQTAFVYDRDTFTQIGEFSYETEGWGITHDGRQLIMSDGSNTLTFRDPESFAQTSQIQVFDGDVPVTRLNELEYINDEVWANVWQTDRIARINPNTGEVTGWVDLTGLRPSATQNNSNAVLNGIAYDPQNGRLFVTGKLWPTLFEIELLPVDS